MGAISVFSLATFDTEFVPACKGDLFLLRTDGLLEVTNSENANSASREMRPFFLRRTTDR
jgi:hypothetical protein